jgi:exonuclease VII large subunit
VSNATDMTAFVTRGELKEEFAQFEQRLEGRLAQMATRTDLEVWGGALDDRLGKRIHDAEQRLDKRIDGVEQRMESMEQRLDKRIDGVEQRMESMEQRLEDRLGKRIDEAEHRLHDDIGKRIYEAEHRLHDDIGKRIDEAEQRLHDDIAMLAKAHQESMATLISVIDEKYADLPARVKRLEGTVFRARRR